MRKAILAVLSIFFVGPAARAASDDTVNIRTSPLGLVIGVFNVRGDYRIGDQLTVGAQVASLNMEIGDVEMKGGKLGVNVVYHLEKAFEDGWYFDAGIGSASIKLQETDSTGVVRTAEAKNAGISGMFGYHWFWETFNLNLGGGIQTNSAGEIEIKDASGTVIERVNLSGATFAADFSIGWTF